MLKKIGIGCGVIVGLFVLLIVVVAIAGGGSAKPTPTAPAGLVGATATGLSTKVPVTSEPTAPALRLPPGIARFMSANDGFGVVTAVAPMPDWAQGKRYEVQTTTGGYLFYLCVEEVSGVYRYESGGARTNIYRTDCTAPRLTPIASP